MKFIPFFLILALLVNGYRSSQKNTVQKNEPIEITIHTEIIFQTIDNFGASDAWSCQFVGNWPEEQKNRIADLLFSLEMKKDGSPLGIGLSSWRFNIGAGSTEQQGDTKIGDPWRRTECFLQKDGTYNWQKQSGQRWFLKAAKDRGVNCFIGFVNSPPVWLTKNGRANSDGGNSMNLPEENLSKYADFLVEVTKNIHKKEGILFDFLSPVNEPQWDWKSGQEGSPWKNSEVAEFCRILGNDLKNEGLNTRIEITEAGKLTHLFDRGNDSRRGFQVKDFFSPGSPNYIGDVPNMAHLISGHSYHTVQSDSLMNLVRSELHTEIQKVDPKLDFWMSEYCILVGNGKITGGGRDLGMETALFVANIIHSDVTVSNASAWQWWLAVSPYNFKDGLVYIDKSETGGIFYDSKLLWALGNYSRFVRPGSKRISVEMREDSDLRISAFKNNTEIVLVVLNQSNNPKYFQLNSSNSNTFSNRYETSDDNNLAYLGTVDLGKISSVPGKSISTFVITI